MARVARNRRVVLLVCVCVGLVVAACSRTTNPLEGASGTGVQTQLVVAEFAEHADLRGVSDIADWGERGRVLVERLQATATSSQRDARQMAMAAGVDVQSYWITNAMIFAGDEALAERVRRLPGVAQVYLEPKHANGQPSFAPLPVADISLVPWNVAAVGAPTAWAAGRTGSGAVLGVIDTGVDVTHPALAKPWRGPDGWFDATGECAARPCDTIGHGTHVTGIAVGGPGPSGGPAIGVAPGAAFIAAKACGADGCLENDLLDAAQWMLAPNGRPADRPTVLVNSWDLASSDTSLDQLPDVWRAAGQAPVFAAGNAGPGCATIGAPAGQRGALAVGALKRDQQIDPASSRAASPAAVPKPDIWSPGVDIASSLPGGGYGLGSGTSMAAPHVAGALALRLGSDKNVDAAINDVIVSARVLDDIPSCVGAASASSSRPAGAGRATGDKSLDVGRLTGTAPSPTPAR